MPETGSKTSMVPVVWATFGIFSTRSKWFPVAIYDHGRNLVIPLWPWDKATSNGVAAYRLTPPQKFRVQKSSGKVLASIFWDQDGILHTVIFHRAKLPRRSITHLFWCNWRTFWRKNAVGRSPRGSSSCATKPRLTGHLNLEETGLSGIPTSGSPTLFSGSGPVGLPTVTWTGKKNERSPFFVRRGGHCWRGDLVGRTFWNFFEWLVKVRATG